MRPFLFPRVRPAGLRWRWAVGVALGLLGGCSAPPVSLSLSWQQELFWQRSACADHHYPHRAVVAHLDGLPCDVAQQLDAVTWCADGFCQTARRDGNRWGYANLFGEAVHHEQFRVFHDGGACEASVLFYPPDAWAPRSGLASVRWSQAGQPTSIPLTSILPAQGRRDPLTLDVWKTAATSTVPAQLCAQAVPFHGPGSALLTLQTKPPGQASLYTERETPVGTDGAQACMPLNGSRYAAAFVFVHTDDANVERKLEIDNPDAPMFACGDGGRRPAAAGTPVPATR